MRREILTLLVIALGTTACMISPKQGDVIIRRSDPLKFEFYALSSGARIDVQCRKPYADDWTTVFSLDANEKASVIRGDSLYPASTTRALPSICWHKIHGVYQTLIRPRHNGQDMRVYDRPGSECIGKQFNAGKSIILAGNDCALTNPNSTTKAAHVTLTAIL